VKPNLWRIVRHPIGFSKALSPFTLSHHPDCQSFSHHCLRVRGHRLCIGCFTGIPTTLAAFFALILASSLGLRLGFLNALLLGVAVEVVAFPLKAIHAWKRVSVRVGLKMLQAVGVGFLFYAPLTLQAPLLLQLLVVFLLYMIAYTVLGAARVYEAEKTCGACEYKGNWNECPGFRATAKKLHEAGFLTT
jgi:hypothetical protein